jgi:hypothetical protein
MRWVNAAPAFALAIALGSVAHAQPASSLPRYDIARNCKAESADTANTGQTVTACSQDETKARDEVAKQWSQYRPAARRSCTEESSSGDIQSYVELQTCLEMSKDADKSDQ